MVFVQRTLDDRTLTIPCNQVVSPSTAIRKTGEGMPISKTPGQKGDLVIKFQIQFPHSLAESKKAELRRLLS